MTTSTKIQKLVAELILAARQGKTNLTNQYTSKFLAIISDAEHATILEQIENISSIMPTSKIDKLETPNLIELEQWLEELKSESKLLKSVK